MVEAIYKEQKPNIKINGELMETFNILKGTRQGCPPSPLLYIMVSEALANVIRGNTEFKGVQNKKKMF